ncbi:hypothetical protein CFC21_079056 [Triticum aestivum]|uniref:PGG domain-containing protein n=4 Tax=Triticinae TaxID=1648030 RepID=A0A9R1I057_WHEAT|nr:uncharacterized protein LOC109759115 [Aegilops tauschii subsp. strangulata]XP_044401798.1 uncharacterized protein LOC123125346 [Triticum aestivum]KAF7074126.1 hypothetical protein CFC21_079036 [Triticum aestivum]KAF7074146.1 hypothetical protein CFC21_079056 [Triticum aestivum]
MSKSGEEMAEASAAEQGDPQQLVAIGVGDLKQALKKDDPFDRLTHRDKAFIEAAKIFTVVCAGAINMLNVFATTMSYNHTVKEFKRVHAVVKHVFISLTIAMFPYTICVSGLAHAVAHKTRWINVLALCMLIELCYVGTICTLCGYYLTETSKKVIFPVSSIVTGILLFIYFMMFRRPGPRNCGPKKKTAKKDEKSPGGGA